MFIDLPTPVLTHFEAVMEKKCIPCSVNIPVLKGEELTRWEKQLSPGWKVIDGHHLEREYTFKNFADALAFTNKVGALAEQEGHHPDIYLAWGKVTLQIWTHKIDGLSESDFILATKCDTLS